MRAFVLQLHKLRGTLQKVSDLVPVNILFFLIEKEMVNVELDRTISKLQLVYNE